MRWVEFRSPEVPIKVRAILTGPTKLVQHHSEGWQQQQRMMRMSYTEWQGAPGWEMQIPILFDGLRDNVSQEGSIRALEQLGIPWDKFEPKRPPVIIIDSRGDIPHDVVGSPTKRWVIALNDWGDYTSNRNFKRVRQPCTVTVWEWFPDQIMSKRKLGAPPGGSQWVKPGHLNIPRTYRIKKGDTLQKIAARFYGDQGFWRSIARANNIRDPNHLKVGSTIRLPDLVERAA